MSLPIDTTQLKFLAGTDPDPMVDYESQKQRLSRDGQPIYRTQVVALPNEGEAEIVLVRTNGAPQGLRRHALVRITGLSVREYNMNGQKGLTYWATAIEPDAPSGKAS